MVEAQAESLTNVENAAKKSPKRGIIYLSTIPPYMNVTKIREVFGEFGKVERVYLQLTESEYKLGNKKSKKKKPATKYTEGWVEFERKSIAKKVVQLLNNTQVSTRKKSKQYDCIWSLQYLSRFKWTHLHERLAYEKAARRQKLRTEIQLAKKKTNFFTSNLDNKKKDNVNKELVGLDVAEEPIAETLNTDDRTDFLQSLFT